jgi:hypothetical protein
MRCKEIFHKIQPASIRFFKRYNIILWVNLVTTFYHPRVVRPKLPGILFQIFWFFKQFFWGNYFRKWTSCVWISENLWFQWKTIDFERLQETFLKKLENWKISRNSSLWTLPDTAGSFKVQSLQKFCILLTLGLWKFERLQETFKKN